MTKPTRTGIHPNPNLQHPTDYDIPQKTNPRTNLIAPVLGLQIRIVPRPNGPHGGGLVAGVGLRRVLKVGVGPPGTVDADVAGHADVRAAVRLAHHRHHGDLQKGAGKFKIRETGV